MDSKQALEDFFYDLFKEYDVKVDSLEVCDGKQIYSVLNGGRNNIKYIISILVNGAPSNMMFHEDKFSTSLQIGDCFIQINKSVFDAVKKFVDKRTAKQNHKNIKDTLSAISKKQQ